MRRDSPDAAGLEALSATTIRAQAGASAAIVGLRGLAIGAISLIGNLVLARLLTPRDFGVVAFGATLMVFVNFLSQSGLGAGLVQRERPPTRAEIRTLLGLQLLLTTALSIAGAAVGLRFGEIGHVTAVMIASVPILAFKMPGTIALERRLSYRPLAAVDLTQALTYFGWAIATVAAGWGVWGVASAAIVRSLAGVTSMMWVVPEGRVLPRFALLDVRSLLAFGVQFQALGFLTLLRDQVLNIATAAIAGVATLGLWHLASQLLQVRLLVLAPLYRVAFPALSRLRQTDTDMILLLERGIAQIAVVVGLVLTPLVASAPAAVPLLFGPEWQPVVSVLPWGALAAIVAGPTSVVAAGYLLASGHASAVLRANAVDLVVWTCAAALLLPFLGVVALGIGFAAAAVASAWTIRRAVAGHLDVAVFRPLIVPTSVAVAAATAGWLVSSGGNATFGRALLGAAIGSGLHLGVLLLVSRRVLVGTFASMRRALASALDEGTKPG